MKIIHSIRFPYVFFGLVALAISSAGPAAQAQQNWNLAIGAETQDMGRQALAFLPNEIWIHAGDSITWTWQSDEIHTLTFLAPGQITPIDFTQGCPGFATTGASFDGSTCLTTQAMVKGQAFTVAFPTAGNYKFECLVHPTMSGAVHVLNAGALLPHNQDFYDLEAANERSALLTDADRSNSMDMDMDDSSGQSRNGSVTVQVLSSRNRHSDGVNTEEMPASDSRLDNSGSNSVVAGVGEVSSNAGGYQTSSLLRFVNGTITIHAGDTVEWTNHDPIEPHTITFAPESDDPANPFPSSANVTVDADGALHAIINSPSDIVHSGAILQALEDEGGLPSNPLAANPTRFRATFKQPGTYNYHCVFHDSLGMVGQVVVTAP